MSLYDTPESVRGLKELPQDGRTAPTVRPSVLPAHYSPKVAGYARGPFLEPTLITPSHWLWRNARTYVVRHSDGLYYRALKVSVDGQTVGWWAVELLGTPLDAPAPWPIVGGGCTCGVNPRPFTYYGAVEPGDALDPDSDCPQHFPRA